jgi:hypothetical protein
MARAAMIGPEIHAQVTDLVASGMSKSDAFKQVARERKSSAGTVSANYHRLQRQQGQGGKRGTTRTRRSVAKPSVTKRGISAAQRGRRNGRTRSDGDLASLAKQIGDLTQELVRRVEERDQALRELVR